MSLRECALHVPFMARHVSAERRLRLLLAGTVLALACNSDSTQSVGPPAQVLKSGGDAQAWYFNNTLPVAFSVKVVDANSTPLPGVRVDWSSVLGGGGLSPMTDSTDSKGIAQSVLNLNSATTYVVNASVSGLPSVTFSATASAPPTTAAVTVKDNFFQPDTVVVQANDTVYWTWAGSMAHNVSIGVGHVSPTQTTGSYKFTYNGIGSFGYSCTIHARMNGTVIFVN